MKRRNFIHRKLSILFMEAYRMRVVSIAYLFIGIPASNFPRLHASASEILFLPFPLMHIEPLNNFALSLWSWHKDIPRSPAGHLLNSSAYVSLIRVCKSIAMVKGGARGEERRGEKERREQAGWRIACGQVVGVRASMSCGLHRIVKNTCPPRYPLRATLVTARGFTGWSK